MRRFPRPARTWSTGRPTNWTRASSRSIRCTPSTTGGRSTPARTCRTASSTRTSSTWTWKASRISPRRGGRSGCWRSRRRSQPRSQALRATEFVEYERVAALKLRFLKLAFVDVSARVARRTRRGRASSTTFSRAKANCWSASPLTARSTSTCTAATPTSGSGPNGRSRTATRNRRQTRAFRRRHWRRVLFYQYAAVADRPAAGRGAAAGARTAAAHRAVSRPGAGHRPLRLATCGRTAPFTWPAAGWARRPTISRPRARTGAFRRRIPSHHREDGYRLFAESIRKNCRHGGALRIDHVMRLFRLYWIPDESRRHRRAPTCASDREDLVRILALESVRNQVVVVGEDLGTVEPVDPRDAARASASSATACSTSRRQRAARSSRSPSTRRRRWFPPPPTTCPPRRLLDRRGHQARLRAGRARRAAAARSQMAVAAARKAEDARRAVRLALLPPDSFRGRLPTCRELTGELHNAIIGFLALTPSQLLCDQPGGPDQGDRAAEPARHHLAVSQLGPQDAVHGGGTARVHGSARDFTAMLRHWIGRSGRRNVV